MKKLQNELQKENKSILNVEEDYSQRTSSLIEMKKEINQIETNLIKMKDEVEKLNANKQIVNEIDLKKLKTELITQKELLAKMLFIFTRPVESWK